MSEDEITETDDTITTPEEDVIDTEVEPSQEEVITTPAVEEDTTQENTQEVSAEPKGDTEKRHDEALAAGFENTEQYETFQKQKAVARQQGMPEPVGPTAPSPAKGNVGITEEQKKAIAKQGQQAQATSSNEKAT